MRLVVAYASFALGAWITLLNVYLSWIRTPLLRSLGRSPRRWVSGFPIIGSALLIGSAILLRRAPWVAVSALTLAALDTGGFHSFLAALWLQRRHRNNGTAQPWWRVLGLSLAFFLIAVTLVCGFVALLTYWPAMSRIVST